MNASVLKQVSDLSYMTIDQLRERWRELYCADPPGHSKKFLAKRLTYRIQELAYGGLSEAAKARMREVASGKEAKRNGRSAGHKEPVPVAGTRLIREWQGVRHEVTVTGGGFEYEGRMYKSLSAIARTITGTRWNGPLFFGLRGGKKGGNS